MRTRKRLKLIAQQDEDMKTVVHGNIADNDDVIEVYGSQILGTRTSQQDSYYISGNGKFDLINKSYVVASVCDGMGGLSSGEVASRLATEYIRDKFIDFLQKKDNIDITTFLREIAIGANETVYKYGVENCNGDLCGTTMSLAFLVNNYLYWLSVGDSRIYVIRDNNILQITNDHNYMYLLNQKIKAGLMTNEEAMQETNKEALISFIGMKDLDIIDLSQSPLMLEKGDIVLICSDGLTKVMTDQDICAFVNKNKKNLEELAQSLPETAFDRNTGSQDNTTVIIMEYR